MRNYSRFTFDSFRKRVYHLEKGKPMKIGVARTNATDAMFAHQDCGVGVMEDVAREVRQLGKNLRSHLTVPRGGDERIQSGRVEQGRHKLPRLRHAPRPPHYAWMRGDSQEFVQDGPSCVPRIDAAALAIKPRSRRGVKGRISVGSIDQDVGVDDNQCLPAFHGLIQGVPIGNVDHSAAAVEDRQRW